MSEPAIAFSPAPAASRNGDALHAFESRFQIDLREANRALEGASAEDRVRWVLERFPVTTVLSSSFGAQAAVSLHLVNQLAPGIPVVLTDTGYLFPETYRFVDQLVDRLSLNLKVFRSEMSPGWQEARFGRLWEQGLEGIERYNQLNKVEPMDRALRDLGAEAWFAGLRRSQSSTRGNLPVLGVKGGRLKSHPIIDWTDRDIFNYLTKHDLPYHPLWEEGYVSIGDWHTSRKLTEGLTAEDTRFFGLKRECGLHENTDFVI